MSTVGALNHASRPAQTGELGPTTAVILRMWPFIAQVINTIVVYAPIIDTFRLWKQ